MTRDFNINWLYSLYNDNKTYFILVYVENITIAQIGTSRANRYVVPGLWKGGWVKHHCPERACREAGEAAIDWGFMGLSL